MLIFPLEQRENILIFFVFAERTGEKQISGLFLFEKCMNRGNLFE